MDNQTTVVELSNETIISSLEAITGKYEYDKAQVQIYAKRHANVLESTAIN